MRLLACLAAVATGAVLATPAAAWSAPVPVRPGTYSVVAIAWDRAGRHAGAGPIDILVV